jgi:hypothetical protein
MLEIPSTEFIRRSRQYNLEAQREPVAVTNHGKVDGYYMSAVEFAELQKARMAMRHSYTLKSLPDELYSAIIQAKVDPSYDYLNALLDDEIPRAIRGNRSGDSATSRRHGHSTFLSVQFRRREGTTSCLPNV